MKSVLVSIVVMLGLAASFYGGARYEKFRIVSSLLAEADTIEKWHNPPAFDLAKNPSLVGEVEIRRGIALFLSAGVWP